MENQREEISFADLLAKISDRSFPYLEVIERVPTLTQEELKGLMRSHERYLSGTGCRNFGIGPRESKGEEHENFLLGLAIGRRMQVLEQEMRNTLEANREECHRRAIEAGDILTNDRILFAISDILLSDEETPNLPVEILEVVSKIGTTIEGGEGIAKVKIECQSFPPYPPESTTRILWRKAQIAGLIPEEMDLETFTNEGAIIIEGMGRKIRYFRDGRIISFRNPESPQAK